MAKNESVSYLNTCWFLKTNQNPWLDSGTICQFAKTSIYGILNTSDKARPQGGLVFLDNYTVK